MVIAWYFEPEKARRVIPASALSVGLHLAILWFMASGAGLLQEPAAMGPMRFSGRTFELAALGEPSQKVRSPPGADPLGTETPVDLEPAAHESSQVTPSTDQALEALPKEEASDPELDGEPSSEPAQERSDSESESPPSSEDETKDDEKKAPGAKENEEKEAEERKAPEAQDEGTDNSDPFDMGLPGEASEPGSTPPSDTGPYGAEGPEAGTIDIFAAFLRKLPEAAKENPIWESLPPGPAGRIEFTLTINEDSQLLPIELSEDPDLPTPPHLKSAVLLSRKFLVHSKFAWAKDRPSGSQRLALTAEIQRRAPDADTPEQEGVKAFGLEGTDKPTGVYFTFYSGQHVKIEMWRLP